MSTLPSNKRIVILGGGTNSYISNHFAVSAPENGKTIRDFLGVSISEYALFLKCEELFLDTLK